MSLTQATIGSAGDTTITEDFATFTKTNFANGGDYDIANDSEYTTKFIPGLRDFKKKVK
jgi:hypothetical protein